MKHFSRKKFSVFCSISLIALFLSLGSKVQAQVTIGSGVTPQTGALLDLKENDNSTNNSTKGLLYPRVALTYKNELRPMFTDATTAAQKTAHAGLVVFNTTEVAALDVTTFIFKKGLYLWNGTTWGSVASSEVENGLSQTNLGVIKLGGPLTDTTSINMNGNGFSVVTGTKRMTVHGNLETDQLYVNDIATATGSARALVVNTDTRQIGYAIDIPSRMAFMQSATPTSISTTDIRSGIVVPWAAADIASNNELVALSNNEFEMLEAAKVEISAYVCYIGGGVAYTSTVPMEIVVNATIQINKQGTGWVDYSSVRGVYANSVSYYINTLNIPPVLEDLQAGDKLRVRLIQPPAEGTQTSAPNGGILGFLGANHNAANISKPYGTQFSKGMKIIVQ